MIPREVLTEFVRGLGLSDFCWPATGIAALAFETRGALYLEERDETLLMYLSRAFDPRAGSRPVLEQALRLCHYRHGWPFVIQTGLRDDAQLVFLARLPVRELTLPALEQALDLLTRLHERCRADYGVS